MSTKFHYHGTAIFSITTTLSININVVYIVLFYETLHITLLDFGCNLQFAERTRPN